MVFRIIKGRYSMTINDIVVDDDSIFDEVIGQLENFTPMESDGYFPEDLSNKIIEYIK